MHWNNFFEKNMKYTVCKDATRGGIVLAHKRIHLFFMYLLHET